MENYLNYLDKQRLDDAIVRAIRNEVAELHGPAMDGCIQLLYVPLTREADHWLGDRSLRATDVAEYGLTYKLAPSGTHTIDNQNGEGQLEPLNCFGFAHMKIAYMARKLKLYKAGDIEQIQADAKNGYNWEANGFTKYAGAIAVTLSQYEPIIGYHREVLRIWISVSGADKSRIDRKWSLAGARAAIKYSRSQIEERMTPRRRTRTGFRFSIFK